MQDFTGTAYLLNDPDTVFDVRVRVDLNRISIDADGTEIGSWKHDEVDIASKKDRVHITADGETVVLDITSRAFFLDLMGVREPAPQRSRRRRREKDEWEAEKKPSPLSLVNLKEQALANSADPIDRRLAIVMGVAAVLILVGAALTWGPFRLLEPTSFPIGRLLAGFGGLGGVLALYLAYFDESRFTGSAAAVAAGIVTFAILYLYARAAHLGIGFVMAVVGAQTLIVVGLLGIFGGRPAGED